MILLRAVLLLGLLLAGGNASAAEDQVLAESESLGRAELAQCLAGAEPVNSCRSPTLVACQESAGPSFGSMRYCLLNEILIVDSIIQAELKNQTACYQESGRPPGQAFAIEQVMATEQRAWEAYRQAASASVLSVNHDGKFLGSAGFLEAAAVELNLARERARSLLSQAGVNCR